MGLIVIVAVLVVVCVAYVIATYNSFVVSRNKIDNAFANIDTQIQRRFDLVPNLVETVKGYASFEKDVLENVVACRSGYANASDMRQKMEIDGKLGEGIKSIMAVSEAYPELKANINFLELQRELDETEDKLAYARQFYNDAVTIYNTKLMKFPGNMVANMFGLKAADLYARNANQDSPKIKF